MENLINSFAKLDLNDQRNQLNTELQLLGGLIKKLEIQRGLIPQVDIKNYNKNKDKDLSEKEMLTKIYADIYLIEKDVITILAYDIEASKINNN